MDITFGAPVSVPVQTRNAEPNPFTELAASLDAKRDQACPVTVPLVAGDEDASAAIIAKVKRQLALAGTAQGCTLRSTVETGGTAKSPTATVTVWAVDRITKTRKGAEGAEGASE